MKNTSMFPEPAKSNDTSTRTEFTPGAQTSAEPITVVFGIIEEIHAQRKTKDTKRTNHILLVLTNEANDDEEKEESGKPRPSSELVDRTSKEDYAKLLLDSH
jgi:hypothetical protein